MNIVVISNQIANAVVIVNPGIDFSVQCNEEEEGYAEDIIFLFIFSSCWAAQPTTSDVIVGDSYCSTKQLLLILFCFENVFCLEWVINNTVQ